MCELLQGSERETLPDTKGGLIERLIKIKYMKRPEERLHKYKVSTDLITTILSEFCYRLVADNRGIVFDSKEISDFIGDKSADIRKFYKEYSTGDIISEMKEHGFLEDHFGMLSFWHQVFFEYFAAIHVKKIIESEKDEIVRFRTFLDHFKYKKFDEVLTLFFGLISKDLKEKLVKKLNVNKDRREFDRISLLVDISKIARYSKSCIELLKYDDIDVRSSAARALGEIKSPEAVVPLIALLKDADRDVRSSAKTSVAMIIETVGEDERLDVLNKIDRTCQPSLSFYQSLKSVRYIPEGLYGTGSR